MNELRIKIAEFLGTEIYGQMQINLWSILHFFSGVLLIYIFIKTKLYKKIGDYVWILILGLLILWEVFEFLMYPTGLFLPEKSLDIFMDIVLAMIGALIVFFMIKKPK